ncbi:MAG: hypothetical protein JNJ45_04985 [Chthonomonas sp.]|nr:hypothetical protein [Chthonomonas sp.]
MNAPFYERPMVARISRIFGDPRPPRRVTQKQFDGEQKDLAKTAAKPWHEIDQSDYWHYLLDLCYVDLQQDLFDYLFPAFLIRWWEGQLTRLGGPASECDFYRAIDHGQVLAKMMSESRRQEVLDWMTDAYIEGVDAWSENLSVAYNPRGPNDLHGPLWSFNALGQSVPITRAILQRLGDVSTIGRAQWWLVFGTGIIWRENDCPAVPDWTPYSGGGGVYNTGSEASIFDHGFLPENLEAFESFVDYARLMTMLEQSADIIPSFPHGDWARLAWEECLTYPQRVETRLANLIHLLGLPALGGVHRNSLDTAD